MALLDDIPSTSSHGMALAGGLLFAALIDGLVDHGSLTKPQAGAIVAAAKTGLIARHRTHAYYRDAADFLDTLIKRYPTELVSEICTGR